MTADGSQGNGRHMAPGRRARAAILEAAWEELAEAGYAAPTMEGVAAQVGTS